MITTSYGSWNNHTRYNTSPGADILDVVNGGGSEWVERMQASGALDAVETEWRAAIQAALPEGVTLIGDEFIGPHSSDPAYTEAIRESDFKEIIDGIDLNAIIERHDVDNA